MGCCPAPQSPGCCRPCTLTLDQASPGRASSWVWQGRGVLSGLRLAHCLPRLLPLGLFKSLKPFSLMLGQIREKHVQGLSMQM